MDRLTTWKKSSFCADRHCVEVGHGGDGVQMRDGKDPGGPVLRFTRDEWDAFVKGVKNGEFRFDD